MQLAIVRHGEAEPLLAGEDSQRQLTERGRLQAQQTAAWLRECWQETPRLYCSPYQRTRQTAALIEPAFAGLQAQVAPVLVPDSDPRQVLRWLESQEGESPILLVSHMPLVSNLLGWLCDGVSHGAGFQTGQVRLLDCLLLGPSCATVVASHAPAG